MAYYGIQRPAQVSEEEMDERQRRVREAPFDFVGGVAGGLLRFPKAMATQKLIELGNAARRAMKGTGFSTEKYKAILKVKVHWPNGTSHIDEIKGLNDGHALARARSNWPGAIIEVLGSGTP